MTRTTKIYITLFLQVKSKTDNEQLNLGGRLAVNIRLAIYNKIAWQYARLFYHIIR
jgi:hypothetical protein